MKKTYIEPRNTVVALRVRDNVMQAMSAPKNYNISDPVTPESPTVDESDDVGARKSISAWDEW